MGNELSASSRSPASAALRTLLWAVADSPVYRVLIALVIIFAAFTAFSPEFLGPIILPGILLMGAELAILTIGETFVIVSGEIDLSVASVYGWGALLCVVLPNMGVPYEVSFLVSIAFGLAVGVLNWIVTVKFRVTALITTLGTMWVFRGLLTGAFGATFLSYHGAPSFLKQAFGGQVWILPGLFFWFVAISVVFYLVLNHSSFGNWVFATGGSRETARALGVNTDKTKLFSFMISGGLAAFAGAAYLGRFDWFLSRLGMSSMGFGLETEAIVAAVMGGTALTGGRGNILAVCLATMALASFRSGLILAGVNGYWIDGTISVLLIIFCILQGLGKNR
jgi:simple sugar transport system permease protein